jgi:hypothetical protein
VDPDGLPHQQVAALDHFDGDAVGGFQRGAQGRRLRDRDEAVARHPLGRLVGALVRDQGRAAGLLLAQFEPAAGHREVRVPLMQHAAVLGAGGERALERTCRIGVERLQLDVAGGLHPPDPISGILRTARTTVGAQ